MVYCTKCGATVLSGATFCGKCGNPVASQPQKRICKSCNKELQVDMVFCDGCGAKFESAKVNPNPGPSPVPPRPVVTVNPTPAPDVQDNSGKLVVITFVLGFLGVIIAAATDSFGLGEIMVFASIGTGAVSKKVYAIIGSVVFMVILGGIWFGW